MIKVDTHNLVCLHVLSQMKLDKKRFLGHKYIAMGGLFKFVISVESWCYWAFSNTPLICVNIQMGSTKQVIYFFPLI